MTNIKSFIFPGFVFIIFANCSKGGSVEQASQVVPPVTKTFFENKYSVVIESLKNSIPHIGQADKNAKDSSWSASYIADPRCTCDVRPSGDNNSDGVSDGDTTGPEGASNGINDLCELAKAPHCHSGKLNLRQAINLGLEEKFVDDSGKDLSILNKMQKSLLTSCVVLSMMRDKQWYPLVGPNKFKLTPQAKSNIARTCKATDEELNALPPALEFNVSDLYQQWLDVPEQANYERGIGLSLTVGMGVLRNDSIYLKLSSPDLDEDVLNLAVNSTHSGYQERTVLNFDFKSQVGRLEYVATTPNCDPKNQKCQGDSIRVFWDAKNNVTSIFKVEASKSLRLQEEKNTAFYLAAKPNSDSLGAVSVVQNGYAKDKVVFNSCVDGKTGEASQLPQNKKCGEDNGVNWADVEAGKTYENFINFGDMSYVDGKFWNDPSKSFKVTALRPTFDSPLSENASTIVSTPLGKN